MKAYKAKRRIQVRKEDGTTVTVRQGVRIPVDAKNVKGLLSLGWVELDTQAAKPAKKAKQAAKAPVDATISTGKGKGKGGKKKAPESAPAAAEE